MTSLVFRDLILESCECAFSMLTSKGICKLHEIEDQCPNFNKTGDENKRRDYIIQREKTANVFLLLAKTSQPIWRFLPKIKQN
jgi:hypothetical protein